MRPLDDIDRKILALLRENSRRTLADIGGQVGLSVAAVKRRVGRLERDGVIKGYTARIDTSMLQDAIEVVMEVYCADRTSPADIRPSFEHLDEVARCPLPEAMTDIDALPDAAAIGAQLS